MNRNDEAFKVIARGEFEGGVATLERCLSTIGGEDSYLVIAMRDALNRVKRSAGTFMAEKNGTAQPPAATSTSTDLVPLSEEQKRQDAAGAAASESTKPPRPYAIAHAKVKQYCKARNWPEKGKGCKFWTHGNAIGQHHKHCKQFQAMEAETAAMAKAEADAKKAEAEKKGAKTKIAPKSSKHPKKKTLRAAG